METEGILELIAASGAVLLLAAAVEEWGKENKLLQTFVPMILWLLTLLAYAIWQRAEGTGIGYFPYEVIMFFFLCAIIVWDVRKKDEFFPFILFAGTLAQVFSFFEDEKSLPFFWLLAVYLLIKGRGKKEKRISGRGCVQFSRSILSYVLSE